MATLLLGYLVVLHAPGCESPIRWTGTDGAPSDGNPAPPDSGATDGPGGPDSGPHFFVYSLPATGPVHAHQVCAVPAGVLVEELRQNGSSWRRTVPLDDNTADPLWDQATPWNGPIAPEAYDGTGLLDSSNCFAVPAGQYHEGYWRGDPVATDGYYRDVDLAAGLPDWMAVPVWGGPLNAADYPGYQGIHALAGELTGDGLLFQEIWRQEQARRRTVPMDADGVPDWDLATDWELWRDIDDLPGGGELRAIAIYTLRDDRVQEIVWRDNQAWLRTTPPDQTGAPDWSASGGWTPAITTAGQ